MRLTARPNRYYEYRPHDRDENAWWGQVGIVIVALATVTVSVTVLVQVGRWIFSLVSAL